MITDDFWAGELTEVRFDIVKHDCVLEFKLVDNQTVRRREIRCSGISNFRFFSSIPLPWTYAEASELDLSYISVENHWTLEIELWSERAGISVACSEVYVDEVRQEPN